MTFKTMLLAGITASGLMAATPAMAQSNSLGSSSSQVRDSISMDQMASHLRSRGISVEYGTRDDGKTFLGATTASGGKFIVDFRVCADDTQFQGCQLLETLILFPPMGASLSSINTFHDKNSAVSTGISYGELISLSQKVIFRGGITLDNFDFRLELYFQDAETFQRTVLAASSMAVNYEKADFPPLAVATAAYGDAPQFSFPSTGDHVNAADTTFSSEKLDTDGFAN